MSPKRLLCAAAWSLCFAGASAFAQTTAPAAEPADQPGTEAVSRPHRALLPPLLQPPPPANPPQP